MPQQTLERLKFKTSRLLDICSEKELIAQIGHDVKDWPLVVVPCDGGEYLRDMG